MSLLKPLLDRIVIKRDEAPKTTASGIFIPDSNALEKSDTGTVLAVGPGRPDKFGKLVPLDVKVGDRVLFGRFDGQTVEVDKVEYLILLPQSIFGVIEA